MGSGTTAVAAIREGRNYIGIERQPKYVSLAREACRKENEKIEFLKDHATLNVKKAGDSSQLALLD